MNDVSYSRQTLDTPNPIARFAHRRRYEMSISFAAQESGRGQTLLDYGCGEGHFLEILAKRRPDLGLVGFDPYSQHGGGAYRKVGATDAVTPGSVDILTCFEAMEHLTPPETQSFLDDAALLLAPAGKIVISVPIIGGPPVLVKEANRILLHRRRSDYSARELLMAAFLGRPAPRALNVKTSHKGFDFRQIVPTVASAGFALRRTQHSPFTALPWWANSQVFLVFSRGG